MNDIAIRIQNLSKCYQIYNQPQDRLKQPLFYLAFSIHDTLRHELSWTHYSNILHVENEQTGNWLENSGIISRCE